MVTVMQESFPEVSNGEQNHSKIERFSDPKNVPKMSHFGGHLEPPKSAQP